MRQFDEAVCRWVRLSYGAHPTSTAPQCGPGQTARTNQPGAIIADN